MRILIAALLALLPLMAMAQNAPRILVIGDSMLASYKEDRASVGDVVGEMLDTRVTIRAKNGAKIIHGLPLTGAMGMRISAQLPDGTYDWVVMNGGGNDLLFGCGCRACDGRIEAMIDASGAKGDIPDLVAAVRTTGARVIYLGYLRSPGVDSLIESCANEGATLEARLAAMAKRDRGVTFVSLADLVPHGDRSFHSRDRIHPSKKGARAIAARVAAVIDRRASGLKAKSAPRGTRFP